MIEKFGNWEIYEEGIDNSLIGYFISSKTLWAKQDFRGQMLWEKLLQISRKTHVTSKDFKNFIIAFVFAQDYFNAEKPYDIGQISTAQSIHVSMQIVKLREKEAAENPPTGGLLTAKEIFGDLDKILNEENEVNMLPERAK